jgi:hypothetical protein
MRTWRFDVRGGETLERLAAGGYVLAVPHACLLVVAAHHRGSGLVTMVSQSRDGDRAASLLGRLGYDVVRGSTSRGAASAFREMVRRRRPGRLLGLAVDGPRGPAWKVKPGVVHLAAITGLPVVPLVGTGPGLVWPSWDGLRVPSPGARCRLWVGQPLFVARNADRVAAAARVESALRRLREEAGM